MERIQYSIDALAEKQEHTAEAIMLLVDQIREQNELLREQNEMLFRELRELKN